MQPVAPDALEFHRRQSFLEAINRGFAALRADPAASAAYDQEIREWETTLADGDESGETPTPPARI